MLIIRVVSMHYPRDVLHLKDNLWSNYNAHTSNAREEMRYRIIDLVHIGVKLLNDHEGTNDQDVTK